jgi:hypothetical protein
MSKQPPKAGQKLERDSAEAVRRAAAMAKTDEWKKHQAVRAKERKRAAAHEASLPKQKYGIGETLDIVGSAKVNEEPDDPTMPRVISDHRGAQAKVDDVYFSEERQEHVYVSRTEDGQLRGVPESHVARREDRPSFGMSGSYKPGQYEEIFGKPSPGSMEHREWVAAGSPEPYSEWKAQRQSIVDPNPDDLGNEHSGG